MDNSVKNPLHLQILQLRTNMEEQDKILNDIETGFNDLEEIGKNIQEESKTTGLLIEELENDVNSANTNVKNLINFVNKVIEKSGGKCRCFLIVFFLIVCIVLIIIMIL